MSYQPEMPAHIPMEGGRFEVRTVVPGLRYVERLVPSKTRAGMSEFKPVLQQRVCVQFSHGAQVFEWVDVPTEQE